MATDISVFYCVYHYGSRPTANYMRHGKMKDVNPETKSRQSFSEYLLSIYYELKPGTKINKTWLLLSRSSKSEMKNLRGQLKSTL